MSYCKYNIDEDITVEVKPWSCESCTSIEKTHPNYCKTCKQFSNSYNIINQAEYFKNINKINRVSDVFGKNEKILLPVLSCYNEIQFKYNIINLITYYNNKKINGLWLMTTNTEIEVIERIIKWVRETYQTLWIGVNLIGENIFKVFKFIKNNNPDGIWVDKSYIKKNCNFDIPNLILDQFDKLKWNGLYFGGVMFKYQNNDNTDIETLKEVHKYIDVLTTSGDGTGISIEIDKLNYIYNNTKENILMAIASGVNSSNIKFISDKCNIFIVRTFIVNEKNDIILEKLDDLINALNN